MSGEANTGKSFVQTTFFVNPNVSYASPDQLRRSGPRIRLAAQIKAGTVWINCINLYDAAAPFGGYKSSGYGRDLGAAALEQYTEVKTVWVGLE